MSDAQYSCPSCGRHFGRESDRTQHYIKTTDPGCSRVAAEIVARLRQSRFGPRRNRPLQRRHSLCSPPPSPQSHVSEPSELEDSEPQTFSGDFFGEDYTSGDFPGFGDDDDETETETKTDDDEAQAMELNWEPERVPNMVEHHDMDISKAATHPGKPKDNVLLQHLPAHRSGIHVQKFGGQAGVPLPHSHPRSPHGFHRYQSSIPGSDNNIWAPFVSQIDWEVAHWAKMRGPGSTAFSELLAIDGVGNDFLPSNRSF